MAIEILTCAGCGKRNRVDMEHLQQAVCGDCKFPMAMAEELVSSDADFDLNPDDGSDADDGIVTADEDGGFGDNDEE